MKDIEYLKKYYKGNLDDAIVRLQSGEPVQYIVGNVNFYGYQFIVNKNVLIPRFETEELVEKTIHYIHTYFDKKVDILDIGTGSGCIAITLSKELKIPVDAVDISSSALDVAKENNQMNESDVSFKESNLFSNVTKKYDVIISNPPYVAVEEEIDEIVKKNEPHLALYAENHGLALYEKILKEAQNYINDKAFLAFEIGYTQGNYLLNLSKECFPQGNVWVEKDLQGKDRFLFVQI